VPLKAELAASTFVAHGFEMATGCSPLRGTLVHTERLATAVPWTVRLVHGDHTINYRLPKVIWPDAAAVLAAPDDSLMYSAD
jgi:hypothetical protein